MSIMPTLLMIVGGRLLVAGLHEQPATTAEPGASDLTATTLANSFIDDNAQGNLETKLRSFAENTDAGSKATTKELDAIARSQGVIAESKLNLEHSRDFTLGTEDGYTMLRIPFEESAGVLPESEVCVYFDSNSEIVSVGKIVLTEASADSCTVQFWHDGTETTDRLVTEPGSAVSGATAQAAGSNGGMLNDYLASVGGASWASTTIGTCAGKAML